MKNRIFIVIVEVAKWIFTSIIITDDEFVAKSPLSLL